MIDLKVYIQLIFLCVVNVIFSCAGIFLNLLVIVSFWRSSAYLRSKLYYFMIMVLSFFDIFVVITGHPLLFIRLVWWLNEMNDPPIPAIAHYFSNVFGAFSIMALLVMSIERYLGAYYPFFHRTSLTRRRLLTLLALLFLVPIILTIMSAKDLVISLVANFIILSVIVFPPFVFFNYKLFMISRKVRRDIASRHSNTSSPETASLHDNLKKISTCLLAVGCLFLVYIPVFVFIAFTLAGFKLAENTHFKVAIFWTRTLANGNSTLNCLVFFWRNDALRKEGKKAVKALKDRLKFTSNA